MSREWEHVVHGQLGYLDILIVDESAQVLCAIENKTFSSEHHEQLTRYRNALEIAYPTFTRYHVFLTPHGGLNRSARKNEHIGRLSRILLYSK